MARLAEAQLRSLYPGVQVDRGTAADRPATAVAVGRLVSSSAWPLREVATTEARVVRALAGALETAGSSAEVRLRVLAWPVAPDVWQRQVGPRTGSSTPMGTIVGAAIIDALLFHETSSLPSKTEAPQLSPAGRDAQARKRRGVVGFDVGLALEVAGVGAAEAETLLWRLVHFTQELDDGSQGIRWEIRRGAPPPARLAPAWPTGSSPSCGTCRTPRSTAAASADRGRSARHRLRSHRASDSSSAAAAPDRWRSRVPSCRPTWPPSARPARARARCCSTWSWG